MLLIDTLARTVSNVEVPLSILTGFVGAPLYAFLLYKQNPIGITNVSANAARRPRIFL
jgi:ABC-type Fe3+-siderophore transport system permease subunit